MSDYLQKPYLPKELTRLEVAFPASVRHLMPLESEIPDDFWRDRGEARPWVKLQRDWFFKGLRGYVFHPKDGIDEGRALTHLKAIQGSFEPKHEYKEAAVAYLMSLWFDRVEAPKEESKE